MKPGLLADAEAVQQRDEESDEAGSKDHDTDVPEGEELF